MSSSCIFLCWPITPRGASRSKPASRSYKGYRETSENQASTGRQREREKERQSVRDSKRGSEFSVITLSYESHMGGPTKSRPNCCHTNQKSMEKEAKTNDSHTHTATHALTHTRVRPWPDTWAAHASQDLVKVLKNAFAFMPSINHHTQRPVSPE